eukprot:1145382-Rhodomonas_salina.1
MPALPQTNGGQMLGPDVGHVLTDSTDVGHVSGTDVSHVLTDKALAALETKAFEAGVTQIAEEACAICQDDYADKQVRMAQDCSDWLRLAQILVSGVADTEC